MSIWIEFRCSLQSITEPTGDACWSDSNSGAMDMAQDNMKSVRETIKYLEGVAKRGGWVKNKYGWCCPACKGKHPVEIPDVDHNDIDLEPLGSFIKLVK